MSKPRWLELEELDEKRARRSRKSPDAAHRDGRRKRFARWMRERNIRWHDHGDDPDARYS